MWSIAPVDAIRIRGGRPLEGKIEVGGAKNAALPILCATLLSDGASRLRNVPGLRDIDTTASKKALVRRAATLRPSIGHPRATDVGYLIGRSHGREIWASVEDSILVIGPPRSGKGLHIVINAILDAPGAVVTTSTRPDNIAATITARMARGPVAIFDPQHLTTALPEVVTEQRSVDGTRKWVLRVHNGNCVEAVLIPDRGRNTLCISSQVGCVLDCSFCSTGKQGFNGNLTAAEMVGQVWLVADALRREGDERGVTNVVMMGMGEPLLNFDNAVAAASILMDDFEYNDSGNAVTLTMMRPLKQVEDLVEADASSP